MLLRKCATLLSQQNFSTSTVRSTLVTCEDIERIRLIGINRPEKKNCVNAETADQLLSAFEEFDADPAVDVAVLFGHGGTLCAGYDLEEASKTDATLLEKFRKRRPMAIIRYNYAKHFSVIKGPTGMLTSKPTVAAVQGYAVAGGLELALWCDLRVMEQTAVMGVFCRRFGVPLLDGGTVRLPQLIGFSRAMELILTGRPVDGKEAFQIGLSNRLVSCGTGLGQALHLANQIKKFPQKCLRADRRSAYYAAFEATSTQDALDYERDKGMDVIFKESVEGAF
ncbi:3-hydroxypropionyl-coenzyme A dehydratase-like [Tropilaelaps mercedesae]|uniref:3-hydroxypropionyl-coenzyme A dehydratase-like n=1 Tax=Tropilaelaps mercedesae TaxID=418985 RepID=A0A1V9XY36_9ACAR|nr:3-hydroxypropionyl-coenzyme A dehydratase-like [Tropilaelaps mercedesae]